MRAYKLLAITFCALVVVAYGSSAYIASAFFAEPHCKTSQPGMEAFPAMDAYGNHYCALFDGSRIR